MSLRLYPIEDVLPHRPPMILIDEIVSRHADRIATSVTVRAANLFFRPGRGIPSHVAIEWMAQTCGAFAGSQAMDEGGVVSIGFLLGTRDFRAGQSWFTEGMRLVIHAHLEYDDSEIANFTCKVAELQGGEVLASASLNVFHPQDAKALIDRQARSPT